MSGAVRVLVVEDERPLVELITRYLTREGYEVHPAYDGEDALMQARQTDPDVVVLDLMIPGCDGWAVLTEIVSEPWRPEVIVCSARGGEGDVTRARDLGAAAFLAVVLLGVLAAIARVDAVSHSFLVKIDLPSKTAVRSGVFGRARFDGPSRRTLAVPASAAVRRGQLTFVYTVDAAGRARLQPVSPGSVAADRLEILAGVREGDRVVSNPPASLANGARVTGGRP